MPTPVLPFPTYKWRWLSVAPTEGLLDAPVFLGVLRVLARHEGTAPADPAVAKDLVVVMEETHTPIDLVRTPDRNLIRNSGQYWKGTGLLMPMRGGIDLTPFGRKVARGEITQAEFAAIMVQRTVLPNPFTYSAAELSRWKDAHLEIRPLALILEVMEYLGRQYGGKEQAFLTPDELIRVCIPLAGTHVGAREIAAAIASYRTGTLNVSDWPDCVPEANDHRLAKEFLRFLASFGFCRRIPGANSDEDHYALDELNGVEVFSETMADPIFRPYAGETDTVVDAARHSPLPSIIERQRTLTTILARTGQGQFRAKVMDAYGQRCFLTGDSIGVILEAAHIVPVMHSGADEVSNSMCLRVDLHRLYDSGNIRIRPTGEIALSDAVRSSANYGFLPGQINLPAFVNPANIHWRDTYL